MITPVIVASSRIVAVRSFDMFMAQATPGINVLLYRIVFL